MQINVDLGTVYRAIPNHLSSLLNCVLTWTKTYELNGMHFKDLSKIPSSRSSLLTNFYTSLFLL